MEGEKMWGKRMEQVEKKVLELEKSLERERKWRLSLIQEREERIFKEKKREKEVEELKEELKMLKCEVEKMREKVGREISQKGAEKEVEEEKENIKEEEKVRYRITGNKQESRKDILKRRAVLLRKGWGWKEGDSLKEWIEGKIGKVNWKVERIGEKRDKVWLELEKEEDRERLWKMREEVYQEGKLSMDEWLDEEERIDRYFLVKKAKEMEEAAKEWRVDLRIVKNNRYLEINGERFRWNRERKELEKLEKKRGGKEEVEEQEKRKQKEE